ncbi:MAG: hypothetical protein JSV83_15355 [Desulfobacterales bacterium]|nr:MAG: hypothetical protein JSV83_15355 [Desulfobacterales bacterium]
MSLVEPFGATLILGVYSRWNFQHFGMWTSFYECLLLAVLMLRNYKLYGNHHKLFDVIENINGLEDNDGINKDGL